MVGDDYEAIVHAHPEIVLISKRPIIWQGFLSVVSSSNSGRSTRIKVKLKVPNYPSFRGAEINFGKQITFFRNAEFSRSLENLMRRTTKVPLFLKQLQSLIASFIRNTTIKADTYEIPNNTTLTILQELKDAFATPSKVDLHATVYGEGILNLADVANVLINLACERLSCYFEKFQLLNVSLKLQRTNNNAIPWKVVSSDLPEVPVFGSFERNLSTLSVARNKLKLQVDILETSWSKLRQIDEKCYIIDPQPAKPCHLHRRIYLTSSLSMYVKIDPLNPMDLPEIKFLGSETEVEEKRSIVSNNLHNWNPEADIIDNLLMLLDMDEFPEKEEEYIVDENAVGIDEECCICFSVRLDTGSLTDKVCSNEKCKRHYHTVCLLQWLQAVPGNNILFNHIHGACLHCNESISCPIEG